MRTPASDASTVTYRKLPGTTSEGFDVILLHWLSLYFTSLAAAMEHLRPLVRTDVQYIHLGHLTADESAAQGVHVQPCRQASMQQHWTKTWN